MMDYDKITRYVTEPRLLGEIENADGRGAVGDPSCGDRIEIFIKVKDDHITDIRYQVKGCWGSLASAGQLCDLVVGKSIDGALYLDEDDIVNALGGLPDEKRHCTRLALGALHYAIRNFLLHHGGEDAENVLDQ
jgi:nitrogen fixation NifU-like protein